MLELFLELGATDEQADFPIVYAIGKQGIAKKKLTDESSDLTPLLDTILEKVPVANAGATDVALRAQPFNLAYDNFLGRLGVARVYEGILQTGGSVTVKKSDGTARTAKITKLFTFNGLKRVEAESVSAGDICIVAGIADVEIGETITTDAQAEPLPAIAVDEPTITLSFLVNNSPFGGREGKYVTSRQLRDRLEKELEINVGLRVNFASPDNFEVSGRGELHVAILLENMRREGYEMQVSQPQVIVREENGVKTEPFEEVVVDIPSEYQGAVIEKLGQRGFQMTNMLVHEATVRLIFEGPTRGLLGYRNQFIIDTKGEGIIAARVIGFKSFAGEIKRRAQGSMVSMATGKALGYSLWNLQDRGRLFILPATEVYEGQVIGDTSKGEEMYVNPTKGKNLTNVRSSGNDDAIQLVPAYELTIERGLELMQKDEYLEVTPQSVRLRKIHLTESAAAKARREGN